MTLVIEFFSVHNVQEADFTFSFAVQTEIELSFVIFIQHNSAGETFQFNAVSEHLNKPETGVGAGKNFHNPITAPDGETGILEGLFRGNECFDIITFEGKFRIAAPGDEFGKRHRISWRYFGSIGSPDFEKQHGGDPYGIL